MEKEGKEFRRRGKKKKDRGVGGMSYSRADVVGSWEEVICAEQRWCQEESWLLVEQLDK